MPSTNRQALQVLSASVNEVSHHLPHSNLRGKRHHSNGASAQDETASKGAISQLQEYVQGAKLCPLPPNCPVLQWDCDTRMCGTSLEFRATVAFLLDGVPHHVVGAWQPSKQLAKRDAAERTLSLYVGHWGDLTAVKDRDAATERDALGVTLTCNGQHCSNGSLATQNEIKLLEGYCGKITSNNKSQPQWSHKWEENGLGLCQAFVEVKLCDVSHTFAGKPCQDQEAAYRDTARRVLWYLQCPGFEEIMEPDADYVRTAAHAIPEPSSSWTKDDDSEGEERQLAERKTTIMRVQNRLQQAFARQLEAGTSVWFWSYERDPKDKTWPPLFRATVHVPLAGRTFAGGWLRGQREAQIDACLQISCFLDEEFPPRARS